MLFFVWFSYVSGILGFFSFFFGVSSVLFRFSHCLRFLAAYPGKGRDFEADLKAV